MAQSLAVFKVPVTAKLSGCRKKFSGSKVSEVEIFSGVATKSYCERKPGGNGSACWDLLGRVCQQTCFQGGRQGPRNHSAARVFMMSAPLIYGLDTNISCNLFATEEPGPPEVTARFRQMHALANCRLYRWGLPMASCFYGAERSQQRRPLRWESPSRGLYLFLPGGFPLPGEAAPGLRRDPAHGRWRPNGERNRRQIGSLGFAASRPKSRLGSLSSPTTMNANSSAFPRPEAPELGPAANPLIP